MSVDIHTKYTNENKFDYRYVLIQNMGKLKNRVVGWSGSWEVGKWANREIGNSFWADGHDAQRRFSNFVNLSVIVHVFLPVWGEYPAGRFETAAI